MMMIFFMYPQDMSKRLAYTQIEGSNYLVPKKQSIPEQKQRSFSLQKTNQTKLEQTRMSTAIQRPRLGCFVMISEKDMTNGRVSGSYEGWGRKCDGIVYLSNSTHIPDHGEHQHDHIVDLGLGLGDVSGKLGRKAWLRWQYAIQTYVNRFDYVMKADIDTYMLMDHLYEYLSTFNHTDPLYIGRVFKVGGRDLRHVFVAGASVTLSASALSIMNTSMIEHEHDPNHACSLKSWLSTGHSDDVALARCLKVNGILPVDTRDDRGRERFMVFNVDRMENPKVNRGPRWWYHDYSLPPALFGRECCSAQAIAFHFE
jgi:glycoprotein-N-acetylgalactosamine 3-beta-galactosyltransferase